MQIICTSFQPDNHASTSPLSFYRLAAQPTAFNYYITNLSADKKSSVRSMKPPKSQKWNFGNWLKNKHQIC